MTSRTLLKTAAMLGLIAAFTLATAASAGKRGRNVVVKDPVDRGGKFYEPETYARCDIRKVKATVKRGSLLIKATHRGKQASSSHRVSLNTRGGKRSDPEYYMTSGGGLTKVDPYKFKPDAVKVKLKDKKKSWQYKLPLRKIGRPKKTGFQVQTCGEGAVDIAPGKSYYDDTSWDGTIDYQYKNIKTGR